MSSPDDKLEYEFQYSTVRLDAFSGDKADAERLMRDIINKLCTDAPLGDIDPVIDKHLGRKNTQARKLVNVGASLSEKGQRFFGRMALITNKAPKVLKGKDVIDIMKDGDSKFVQITNYVIHFNTGIGPIIMIEFNSSGPRLSDVEWYFRQVSKAHKIATAVQFKYVLDLEYSELSTITNIFSVTVKLDAAKLIHSKDADWYNDLKGLNEVAGYKDVRMELSYGKSKDENGNYLKNIRGLKFGRAIIGWLNKKEQNIEYVDDLKMDFELGNNQEVQSLDFLKNKTTSFVYVKLPFTRKEFNHEVGQEFNKYLMNGTTSQQTEN